MKLIRFAARGHDLMHHALLPPCQPGRAPGQNALMCEQCGVGQYSTGDSCQGCPPGGKLSFWVNVGLYHCFCNFNKPNEGRSLDAGNLNLPATSHGLHVPAGSVPSEHRDTCEDCPVLQYSVSGTDSCLACDLPLALVDNECASGQQHQAGLPYKRFALCSE